MTLIGFILFIIGVFKSDRRFFIAGGVCVAFDLLACLVTFGLVNMVDVLVGIIKGM